MCYEWVIFHTGCKALLLHGCTTIISLLKAALKATVRGSPTENFSKLIFKYIQFQGILSYFEQNKNLYYGKTNLVYFFSLKM